MQEPRPKPNTGCNTGGTSNGSANASKRGPSRFSAIQIGEQRNVVPIRSRPHVRPQQRGQPAATCYAQQALGVSGSRIEFDTGILHEGFGDRQCPLLLVGGRERPRSHLGGLNIGLVEGVDSKHGPSHRRGHLPAEEFLADILHLRDPDPHHGMAQHCQIIQSLASGLIAFRIQTDGHENTIKAIARRLVQWLAFDRYDALPRLAGRLGDELLNPCAQRRYAGGCDERELVTTGQRGCTEQEP